MKFLLVLLFMSSVSVFAQTESTIITCYEPPRQGRTASEIFVLRVTPTSSGYSFAVIAPESHARTLTLESNRCLTARRPTKPPVKPMITLCPTQGQRIRQLIPFDTYTSDAYSSGTIYCDRKIEDYIGVD